MKVKKNVFLLGAYGQQNLGDDLLLQVFIDRLKDCDIVVNSANPEKTAAEFGVKAVSTYGKNFIPKIKTLMKTDVVIFGGGSLLKELYRNVGRWKYSVLVNTLMGIIVAKAFGKMVILSAIGAGPLTTGFSRFLARLSVQMADLITVRDNNSKILLRKIGVKKEVQLVADPVFLRMDPQDKTARGQHSIPVKVGITPAYNVEDWITYEQIARQLSGLADYLIEKHDAEVILIPFQTDFNPYHDVVAGQKIIAGMKHQTKVKQITDKLEYRDVIQLFKNLELIIGMRMHSVLMAAVQSVPVMAISYDIKVQSLMEELGIEQYSLRLKEVDHNRLVSTLEELLGRKEEIRKVLDDRIPFMLSRAKMNFDLLETYVKAHVAYD